MSAVDLVDLVDNPRETLEIELKEWLDLSEPRNRAAIAKHICALANHGGGYIVFGFSDDCTPQGATVDLTSYNHDSISDIALKYLTPPPNCEIHRVTSSLGNDHIVVWVPSAETIPVCARADGPQDQSGRVQGIRVGVHYTRSVGPESTPLNSPELWRPVIRRCVTNDRQALLGQLQRILHGPMTEGEQDVLLNWHTACRDQFVELVRAATALEWPVDYIGNHYQFSYMIHHDPNEVLSLPELRDALDKANHATRKLVDTGWSMFFPFTREAIRPYVTSVVLPDGEADLYEANLMNDPDCGAKHPDFWRVTTDGRATLVRPYHEDRPGLDKRLGGWKQGSNFSPRTNIRHVAEFLRHALALAEFYESAESISVILTWGGLQNRAIADLNREVEWDERLCHVESRMARASWVIPVLQSSWQEAVAKLISRVTVLFDGLEISADWVSQLAENWRR